MSTFFSSPFAGADGTSLETLDASFAKVSGQAAGLTVAANRVKNAANGGSPAYYVNSAVPPAADYSVEADVYVAANGGASASQAGVLGRYSASAVTGYRAMLKTTENRVLLYRQNGGTATTLGQSSVLSIPEASTVKIRLQMVGAVISVYLDDSPTPAISVTDSSPILSAGLAGVTSYTGSAGTTVFHLDNFAASTYEADTTAPTLTSPAATATGQTAATGSVSTNESGGTLYWLASANATESAAAVKAGLSQAVSATGTQNVSLTGLTAATSYYLHFVHTDAAANDSAVATSVQFTTSAADSTPPTLTGPTATSTGQTTATGTVSTNEANGTLYWLASANSSETAATVKAGSSQAVSATGTQSVSLSGLTAATAYYLHYVHRDAAGNDSAVSTSAQFTTSAAVVRGVAVTLYNGSTAQASLTGVRALWWDATAPTGAPDFESTTETTDATGLLSIDIESVTSLSVGQNGFLLLYKLDGEDLRNSLAFAGQVILSDIG